MTLDEIKQASEQGAPAEVTLTRLDAYLEVNASDDEALTLRGMLHWSMGKRSLAINDYLAAIRINPQSRAKQAIASAYQILNFYNKDLFNP